MEEFKKLWKEFVIGTSSLNYHLNKGGHTPFFVKERERFIKRILEPMDAAWKNLLPHERSEFKDEPKW